MEWSLTSIYSTVTFSTTQYSRPLSSLTARGRVKRSSWSSFNCWLFQGSRGPQSHDQITGEKTGRTLWPEWRIYQCFFLFINQTGLDFTIKLNSLPCRLSSAAHCCTGDLTLASWLYTRELYTAVHSRPTPAQTPPALSEVASCRSVWPQWARPSQQSTPSSPFKVNTRPVMHQTGQRNPTPTRETRGASLISGKMEKIQNSF